jgi:hypothetical protein
MMHFWLNSWFPGSFTSKDALVVARAEPAAKIPRIITIESDRIKTIVSPPSKCRTGFTTGR